MMCMNLLSKNQFSTSKSSFIKSSQYLFFMNYFYGQHLQSPARNNANMAKLIFIRANALHSNEIELHHSHIKNIR